MKTVLLTGISSGLGQAFFDYLITKELNLCCISRRFLPYQQEIAQSKANISLVKHDLNDTDNLVSKINEALGLVLKLSEEIVFINNAGMINPIGGIGKLDEKALEESIKVNFHSPVLISNYLFSLSQDKIIKILNISSGAANYPIAGWPMYCSTKAGIKMFFDVLAEQFKNNQNVMVHNIDPGVMDTQMQTIIRKSGNDDFPMHEYFVGLKSDEKLLLPEQVAEKIMKEYLDL